MTRRDNHILILIDAQSSSCLSRYTRVRTLGVVIGDPLAKASPQLRASLEGMEIDALIFQRAPEAFDEDVVHPPPSAMRISREAIYQSLNIQERGALRRELSACLRSSRALRVPRERARSHGEPFINEAIMISERPPEIGDRAVPGHWEGDLILGLGRVDQRLQP